MKTQYEDLLIEDFDVLCDCADYVGDDRSTQYKNGEDGFIITMNERAYPDLYYWSRVTGISVEDIIKTYNGKLIWLDPEQYKLSGDLTVGWVTKDQYLTGRIERKYKFAKQLHEATGLFEENIKLLKKNLPDKPGCDEIHASLGAPWIPSVVVGKFLSWLLGLYYYAIVDVDTNIGKKVVTVREHINPIKNFKTYGTKEMSAVKIVEHIINGTSIKAYDQVPKEDGKGYKSVVNTTRTIYLNQKATLIKEKWKEFLRLHDVVAEEVWEAYNANFGFHISRFDGSYLTLEDVNPKVQLYPYQKDAIAHGLFKRNMLLAHCVGAGKTLIYSATVHEANRLGLTKKALIVVPNDTLDSVANAYKDMFKDDKVLVVHPKKEFKPDNRKQTPKKEFKPDNRKQTLEDIKSDKYQVIFMAYSSFDMLSMSKDYMLKKKQNYIAELVKHEREVFSKRISGYYKTSIKKAIESFEDTRDNFIPAECNCFDELGIDYLVVDEAHNYKNIHLRCGFDNIVGFNSKGSAKAENLLEKVDYLHEQKARLIMATGTPITNSLAELYVFQRYLQPTELKLSNIYHFVDWIATFAEEETNFEVDVDSVNGKFATRFNHFHNLPELMGMLSEVIDFYQAQPDDESLPKFHGYKDIVVKKNKAQAEYIRNLAKRTEAIRAHQVKSTEDNLLKVTVQGRMAATDIRLVKSDAPDTQEVNKLKNCADCMARLYYDHPNTTQIAFSDIGTPKEEFNLYDELKCELISRGIDKREIAFIHDASTEVKRAKLEKDFNDGKLRILIGSTQKLGTGVNVQNKLLAVHHLDVPWRPADMVQREGRLIRQGNQNKEVYIYRYITEASFDAYTYQLLENKQKFISQFLSGALAAVHRDETDCSDTVLSYAEVKALAIGNPLIKERVEVSNVLEHARINQRAKAKELSALYDALEELPDKIEYTKLLIDRCKSDIEHYNDSMQPLSRDSKVEYCEELMKALAGNVMKDKDSYYGDYQGFRIIFPKHMKIDEPQIVLTRQGSNRYTVHMDFKSTALGCVMRLDHALNHLPDRLTQYETNLDSMLNQQSQAQRDVDEGNPYDDEVERLAKRLADIDKELKGEDVA